MTPPSVNNSDRTRGNGLKLHHRMFRFVIRKNDFLGRAVMHWKRLPREVAFKKHVDVALREIVQWVMG